VSEPKDRGSDSVRRNRDPERTVRRILDRAVERYDRDGERGVVVTEIAREAGVSVGAVYHHYSGRSGLVAAARAEQFRRTTESDLAAIRQAVEDAETFEQFVAFNRELVRVNRSPERRAARVQRLAALAAAASDDETAAELRWAQRRLTDGLAEVIERARERGWFDERLDARAWAVALQGLFLGSVLADIDDDGDDEAWIRVVEALQDVGIHDRPHRSVPTGTGHHH
jgi:AcrR family transcriptional regulator